MAIGGAACSSDSNSNEVDSQGNTIVNIMFHVDAKSAEGVAYQKRVDSFNREYSEQKIKAVARFEARSAGSTDYATKLSAMKVEGTLPDIITFDAPNCASYAAANILRDISSDIPADTQSQFYSLNTYNGKLYGLPIQESSAGFYYNTEIFAAAGIDVSAYTIDNPWTYAEFKDVCQKLKDYNNTLIPVVMNYSATTDETATYLLYPFIYASGGSFVSADGYTATGYMDSDATYNGFSFLKSLYSEGYTDYSVDKNTFFSQKAGMFLSSGWTIPELENQYKDVKFGILPYPKDVTAASATGSWSYGITNNGKTDVSAAKELIMYMASAESSKAITDTTGMIPARKDVETNYAEGSPKDVLLKQLAKTGKERPVTVGYPDFSTRFRNVIFQMKENDLHTVLSAATDNLQTDLDRTKKLYQ